MSEGLLTTQMVSYSRIEETSVSNGGVNVFTYLAKESLSVALVTSYSPSRIYCRDLCMGFFTIFR